MAIAVLRVQTALKRQSDEDEEEAVMEELEQAMQEEDGYGGGKVRRGLLSVQ